MSNKKKNDTLGMPHGTALGRLRKMVLFSLLQNYGDDVCVRCGERIETVEDLSLEHIKPWEGISADLFWDLENIAFSHIQCNRPHKYGGESFRKVGPVGTAWCSRHKDFLLIESFNKSVRRWNEVNSFCRDCANEALRDYRKRNSRVIV